MNKNRIFTADNGKTIGTAFVKKSDEVFEVFYSKEF
jgi:hypothetical protein